MRKSEIDKCIIIKNLVEDFSKVLDIGEESRKRELSDLRKIYCKLCRSTTKASFRIIGEVLRPDYNHATVLHNVKEFDKLYFSNQLLFPEVYIAVLQALKETEDDFNDALITEYVKFLDWFRTEVAEETPVESSFFVGKYFAMLTDNK